MTDNSKKCHKDVHKGQKNKMRISTEIKYIWKLQTKIMELKNIITEMKKTTKGIQQQTRSSRN